MAGHERIRLSLSGSRLRHRRHQRTLRPGEGARGRAGRRSSICAPATILGSRKRSRRPRPSSRRMPRSVIACGAGPVVGRTLKLTNAPWVMDGPETARRPASAQGLLLNDFEAQALSLPAIRDAWARRIGAAGFGADGPAGDPGPGHGPGSGGAGRGGRAALRRSPSEACHIDFGPVWPEEYRDLAASRTRARPGDQRKRHIRGRAGAGSSRPDDRRAAGRSACRSARRHRGGPGRPEGRRGDESRGFIGASSPALPATWRSLSWRRAG